MNKKKTQTDPSQLRQAAEGLAAQARSQTPSSPTDDELAVEQRRGKAAAAAPDLPARLTAAERRRRRQLENVVRRNRELLLAVAAALAELQEQRLYRETHESFEEYVADRFGISRRTAYAWQEAAGVLAVHPDAHKLSQSHLRLLAPLDKHDQAALIPLLRETTVRQARAELAQFRARTAPRRRPILKGADAAVADGLELQLLVGDALEQLRKLPSDSVSCCVSSPPYWQKRTFVDGAGELGHEATVDEYVESLVDVFRELRRVLHPSGTFWLNLGDSYGSRSGGPRPQIRHGDGRAYSCYAAERTPLPTSSVGVRLGSAADRKELMLVPAQVALALREDGWSLRQEHIWAKPAPAPESVGDRATSAHEHVFLFVKDRDVYHYDQDAVAEPRVDGEGTRNLRSVWTVPTVSYPGIHYATMPPELAAICIRAGSSAAGVCAACGEPNLPVTDERQPTGSRAATLWQPSCACEPVARVPSTVNDPFAGVGTTPLVALQLGRSAIAIELGPTYAAEMRDRIREAVGIV